MLKPWAKQLWDKNHPCKAFGICKGLLVLLKNLLKKWNIRERAVQFPNITGGNIRSVLIPKVQKCWTDTQEINTGSHQEARCHHSKWPRVMWEYFFQICRYFQNHADCFHGISSNLTHSASQTCRPGMQQSGTSCSWEGRGPRCYL